MQEKINKRLRKPTESKMNCFRKATQVAGATVLRKKKRGNAKRITNAYLCIEVYVRRN